MGIFNSLSGMFGSDDSDEPSFKWKVPEDEEAVENILGKSEERVQLLFKHSSRCATSYFARKSLENFPEERKAAVDFHMVDVIQQRQLSGRIADKFNIRHESPQLFILKDNEVIWHGSHSQVSSDSVLEVIQAD